MSHPLAWISLAALFVAIILSCFTKLNVGLVSIVLAWVIGVYLAPAFGKTVGIKEVVAGFPSDLFLTLTGVMFLFAQAQVNGTLERVAHHAVRLCRGNAGMIPILFFVLTLAIGSVGAGNIAIAALMGPLAMAAAARAGIPAFLMTLMVAHGAIASALSPIAPTGIVAANLMETKLHLTGLEWRAYLGNLFANAFVAFAGYFLFGGWRLFRRRTAEVKPVSDSDPIPPAADLSFQPRHWITLAIILALVAAVVICSLLRHPIHIGMGAFAAAAILTIFGLADETAAIKTVPWGVLVMVCGVTVLTSLLEKKEVGGLALFSSLVARSATPGSIVGIFALIVGLVSVYSSTIGVVLPTFLPMVNDLVQSLGGGDPVAIAMAVLVGGHLVDVSPLSTIGALCVAGASPAEDRKKVFNRVLLWGLSMSVVGGVLCQVFFGWLKL